MEVYELQPSTPTKVSHMNKFRYTSYAQEIIFGAGSLAQLADAVERFQVRRLMLCATSSLRRG